MAPGGAADNPILPLPAQDFWQTIHPPGSFPPAASFADAYPARFADGRQILLPLRALPDGVHAAASLIINQASFAVLGAIAADLAAQLGAFEPELIVGLPTLGLTLAAAVAQRLGHARYVPLGTSRKFWYDERLGVPLSSITSPGQGKTLYIDPRLTPLLRGRRIVLIDDVISTGQSMRAGRELLGRCAVTPVAIATAMLQSARWENVLGAEIPVRACLRSPLFTRAPDGDWRPAETVNPPAGP